MQFATFTNSGGRSLNEDYCGTAMNGKSSCFVLADGLGGHGGGDIASKCAVESVCKLFVESGFSEHFFSDAFHSAQEAVLEKQEASQATAQMKTTLVIAVIHEGKTYYSHVGDSRFYYFKNKRYEFRTLDHSVPQMLVLSKQIKESEIRNHPDRNRLMRVLGVKGERPKFEEGQAVKNSGSQAMLLCTDGFWELIDEKAMEDTLRQSNSPEMWLDRMSAIVRDNGKDLEMDNYTAIAVFNKTKGMFGI